MLSADRLYCEWLQRILSVSGRTGHSHYWVNRLRSKRRKGSYSLSVGNISKNQVLINALTGEVGTGTQVTGNPTYQELAVNHDRFDFGTAKAGNAQAVIRLGSYSQILSSTNEPCDDSRTIGLSGSPESRSYSLHAVRPCVSVWSEPSGRSVSV